MRKKKLEVAVINITTHPHSPDKYLELFSDVFAMKRPVKYRGEEFLLLGRQWALQKSAPLDGIHSVMFKYVNIDLQEPWLDLIEIAPVESEDGQPVIDIPDNLKPNCKATPFVFFPVGHRLFLISSHDKKQFSPALVAKSLALLFNSEELLEKYGTVDVTVESSDETIEKILSIPALTKLFISIALPNGDDVSDKKREVIERLQRQKAKKVQYALVGRKTEGLSPDDETQAMMGLAMSNGYVKAEGYDGDVKLEESTSRHPVIIKDTYGIDEAPLSRLISIARQHLDRLITR